MFLVIGGLSMMSHHYTLGNIKSRTVGDGQHGTARWATDKPPPTTSKWGSNAAERVKRDNFTISPGASAHVNLFSV